MKTTRKDRRDIMDKTQLLKDIDVAFARQIEELRKSVQTSQEMTRDAPGRIESRYDTSREETGWLATGQAALLGEWEHNYASFKAIRPERKDFVQTGAFFEAESLTGQFRIRCFVCRGGGGLECETAEGAVTLISPTSPLAEAAIGRSVNDTFTVNGRVDYVIREVT
jgi:hypothetical protein